MIGLVRHAAPCGFDHGAYAEAAHAVDTGRTARLTRAVRRGLIPEPLLAEEQAAKQRRRTSAPSKNDARAPQWSNGAVCSCPDSQIPGIHPQGGITQCVRQSRTDGT